MEAAVDQCFVDKNAFEIQIKQLSIDNDQLLKQIMSQGIMHIAVHSVDILDVKKSCDNFRENQNAPTNQLFEINELKAQSQENDTVIKKLKDRIKSLSGKDSVENIKKDIDEIETINNKLEHTLKNELRKLKGKNVVDTTVSRPSATIAPGIFKLDIEPISRRLKNNKDAHEVYFEKTIENTDILRGLEVLVYVSKSCPSLTKPCEKLFVVTPMNKDKKVRFAKPVTSSSNIPKQTDSRRTKYSNKPLLTSIGVNTTTSASGSKPSGNTNNTHVKHSVRNAKFKSIYAIGNKCLFDANHDMRVIDYVNDVNYQKDHLCSAYALGKSKKYSHKPKAKDFIQEKLYLLHMDLYGPMRIQSMNGRKYILVIVDDYSRFTWVKFLQSKDEVPEFVIKFLKIIQVRLNEIVRNIRTDNGTKFVNQTLRAYYEEVRISHQTSVARTMLIFSKAPLFLWAEAVATACYTKNRSLIRKCHNKTPYKLLHDRKPNLSYLHVFGALFYPTNDGEYLGKLKPKADIGIFVGYATAKKAFRIYNKRTRMIIETIHVDFDELTAMGSE
ncbi:retrovirus-related pol polyprotein from transposon TNT 1-94 [Tanacetum coccineum]